MQRIGRIVGSGMLLALFACSSGSSDSAASLTSSPAPASTSASTPSPVATPLEGTWRSVIDARTLEHRGFSAKQIHLLQAHDEWSSRQVNEIKIEGNQWVLGQGMDGDVPTSTGDFGKISMTKDEVRLDEFTCILTLRYKLHGAELRMNLIRSTCDDLPTDSVPDFMYSAVFGESYQRQS